MATLLSATQPTFAQMTTARVRGTVTDGSGAPLSNARVTISHAKGQITKNTSTNEEGVFVFSGLKVGGPYTLTASKSGYKGHEQSGIKLGAGSNPSIQAILSSLSVETMTVVASRAKGPMSGRFFDSENITQSPSGEGDIKDIVRLSPDAYTEGDSLVLGGNNNRFNSITVDGMRQDDDFGLSGNGYPTQRSPVSLNAIEEISVNRTPFDVRYGNFIGGNVNVVTKSGTNEFEGVFSYQHANDRWEGKETKDINLGSDFERNILELNVAGPIIKNKLFYFVSVDKFTETIPNNNGVAGSGLANEATDISAADVAQIQSIAQNVYGYDAGIVGQSRKDEDFRFLGKLDYEINDSHRLEGMLQLSQGSDMVSSSARSDELHLTSNWYENKQNLRTSTLRLFSDWNNELSTKVELSNQEVVSNADPLGSKGFMEATIVNANEAEIVLGPDPFRQANEFKTETLHFLSEASYLWNSHLFTAGFSLDKFSVYNLFGPFSSTTTDYDSIEDFQNQIPSGIYYQNAISNNVNDLAADWGFSNNTLYLQDEFEVSPYLTTMFGVRAESYSSSGDINYNSNFESRHGFTNTSDLGGKQLILPRVGMVYQPANRLTITGGMGLYAGGTPNVWISNNYSNDGVNVDSAFTSDAAGFDGRTIPDSLTGQLQAGDGNVDALDPDFQLPHSFKFATGAKYSFEIPYLGKNWNLSFDYSYTQVKQALLWQDLRRNHAAFANNQPTAVGPDGRPLYDTDLANDVETDFDTRRGYDILLTNTQKGFGHNLSLALSKNFSSGFFLSGSYAWQRVQDVNPGTSSRSVSNYGQVAIEKDPNNPGLGTSNYERKHRFVINTGYSANIFDNLFSSFNLFFERRSGRPFSYTFGGRSDDLGGLFGEDREFAKRERMLFYVPKGDGSDVIFDENFDEDAFNLFLDGSGLSKYRGKIAPRNAFYGDWVDNVDFRYIQELPAYSDDHSAQIQFNIQNLPNFLNKRWGQQREPGFPYFHQVVNVDYDAGSGRYIYSNLDDDDSGQVSTIRSIWRMQVTAFYRF